MEVILTEEHKRVARQAGACREALRRYEPGISFTRIRVEDLIWVEDHFPERAREIATAISRDVPVIAGVLPLWAFGDGTGYGYGYGYGYGSGHGSGYGYGYGTGYGTGTGDGAGESIG